LTEGLVASAQLGHFEDSLTGLLGPILRNQHVNRLLHTGHW
jgi:hypothetical protein